MLILAVDTGSKSGSLALLRDRQVLATVSDSQEVSYAERLFRNLDALRAEAQISLKDVDLFAVGTGPGSFTALRVGLSAVKAWAEVYGKPIAAISGLEAIAAQSRADGGLFAPFLDARREEVFCALYRRVQPGSMRLVLDSPEAILSAEAFCEMVKERRGPDAPILVSTMPSALALQSAELIQAGFRIEQVSPVLAPAIGLLGFERASRGEVISALDLDANYVRRSDAEVKKGS